MRAWAMALLVVTGGCGLEAGRQGREEAALLTGGDAALGEVRLRQYGCAACHTIPGIAGADARVGPPLSGIAGRMYIAGLLPNNPENLVRWIQDPIAIDSSTAMPDVRVTAEDARHIAAYLYTLE